jgi:REP element-mobilizing transposase RayT
MPRMPYDPERHHRRSVRIPGYDYSQPGWCFVTVCTHLREPLFGDLERGRMRLTAFGEIVVDTWFQIDVVDEHLALDEFFLMPDHLHGIIIITDQTPRGAPTLGCIVARFKSHSARRINRQRGTPGAPVWQRSFYEHVIRNERDLERIRKYIANNRWRWPEDEDLPGKLVGL